MHLEIVARFVHNFGRLFWVVVGEHFDEVVNKGVEDY